MSEVREELYLWQAYCEKKMQLEDAQDEIDRLRDALTKIASQSPHLPGKMFVDYAREVIARAALGEGGNDEP